MKAYRKICLILSFVITIAFLSSNNIYANEKEDNKVFSQNREKSNMIALTFDDGPHPRYTPQIIEILKEYGVTATFFIIGINAVNYPDAMQAIVDSGCEIGNHTFSHHTLVGSREESIYNIMRCEEEISRYINTDKKLLRPPEGKLTSETISAANSLDYNIILWSIDTLDWNHTSSASIAKNVLSSVKGGDIILMHDYVSGKNTTCEALRTIIPQLLARGYKFVTVSELIA